MFNAFQQRYPAGSVLAMAAAMALLSAVWSGFSLGDPRPISSLSAAAFSAASVLFIGIALQSVLLERILRAETPLWRIRATVLWGLQWFVLTSLLAGTAFPSVEAVVQLAVSGGFGFFMTFVFKREWIEEWYAQTGARLFDTERPFWATRTADWWLRVSWTVPLAVAVLVSVFGVGSTALGYLAVIGLSANVAALPLTNMTKWRERDVIIIVAVVCLLTGLFAA